MKSSRLITFISVPLLSSHLKPEKFPLGLRPNPIHSRIGCVLEPGNASIPCSAVSVFRHLWTRDPPKKGWRPFRPSLPARRHLDLSCRPPHRHVLGTLIYKRFMRRCSFPEFASGYLTISEGELLITCSKLATKKPRGVQLYFQPNYIP